jgi:hypothetical protein
MISLEHDSYFLHDFLYLLAFGVYLSGSMYDRGHCVLHVLAIINNIFLKDIGLLPLHFFMSRCATYNKQRNSQLSGVCRAKELEKLVAK